jgi:hypothetical protein
MKQDREGIQEALAGCFMIGCCGSPMLGIYLGIFGAKALSVGKPLMTLVS